MSQCLRKLIILLGILCWSSGYFRVITAIEFYELIVASENRKQSGEECSLWLTYSDRPYAGRGIYAGKDFQENDLVGELSPSIIVPRDQLSTTTIIYYDFGTGENSHGMAVLGPGSIFNHHDPPNVVHHWIDPNVDMPIQSERTYPNSALLHDAFFARQEIKKGEEILNFYGSDWFERNQMTAAAVSSPNVSTESHSDTVVDSTTPVPSICLSDVTVAPSTLPSYYNPTFNISLGYGLFAKRSFRKGELITVTPVLVFPRDIVDVLDSKELEMKRYCYELEDTNLLLFPMGMTAMMNHHRQLFRFEDDPRGDKDVYWNSDPNVAVNWFDWWDAFSCASDHLSVCRFPPQNQPEHLQTVLSLSPEELIAQRKAPLDLGFYALRDIAAGEELFIDYGIAFEQAMDQMLVRHNQLEGNHPPLVHYQGISFPDVLIPTHWKRKNRFSTEL